MSMWLGILIFYTVVMNQAEIQLGILNELLVVLLRNMRNLKKGEKYVELC